MCKQILVVDESGISWQDASTIEGSLDPAQENIRDYLQHLEDRTRMFQDSGRYMELVKKIDMTLMMIGNKSVQNEGHIPQDWLNMVWGLTYDEQLLLLRKRGLLIKG